MNDTKQVAGSIDNLSQNYLNVLLDLTKTINNNSEFKEIIQQIIEKCLVSVGADCGSLFLSKSGNGKLLCVNACSISVGAWSHEKQKIISSLEIDTESSLTGKLYASGSNEYFEVFDESSLFNRELIKGLDYDVNNIFAVPVSVRNKTIGILSIYNKYVGGVYYSDEQRAFINAVAWYIGMLVENNQLLAQMNTHVEKMNVLINSMELVNSNMNLSVVLDTLMQLVMKIISAEAASILLMDEAKQKLKFVAASGKKEEEIKHVTLELNEGVAGWVATHGAPLLIPDVSYDKRFSFKADQQTGFVTRSILAVPLKLAGKVIGVVEAVNKQNSGEFTNDDMKTLMTFATTGAMALQKAMLFEDLNDLFLGTLRAIADAIEAKDPYTRGHSERIRRYSLLIAERLGLDENQKRELALSALLHDVGKIGVPEEILVKKDELSVEEWACIRRHPSIGADMLSSIKQLKSALPGIRHHQERYDGRGYPSGLSGDDIPLYSRIIAVVDTFDSMNTDRPYRKRGNAESALTELKKHSGTQFDPVCVNAFLEAYTEKQN